VKGAAIIEQILLILTLTLAFSLSSLTSGAIRRRRRNLETFNAHLEH